jgi:hypothetical protein
MKSDTELAHRIETGIETKSSRYDWASWKRLGQSLMGTA